MELAWYPSVDRLPADAQALLNAAPGLFAGCAWWRVVEAAALPEGCEPCFVVVSRAGRSIAVFPMLRDGRQVESLTTFYTCDYAPAFAADADGAARVAASRLFARFCRRGGVTRLDSLAAEWPALTEVLKGARQAGLWPLRFDHFGNWYEHVGGSDWSTYLANRTGVLRETIRRRSRRAEKLPDARFELLQAPHEMDRAAEAFESVYRRSWKQPEPYPAFNVSLMRAMADAGLLRLGIWSVAAEPVAVQFWAVKNGRATVLKLAHDEAYKAHSPGTVLTALMLRHLLDVEHVAEIDFGRGDDPYKEGWATQRRQHIGILLANPWQPAGAAALLRHAAGRLRRRIAFVAGPRPKQPVPEPEAPMQTVQADPTTGAR